MLANKIDENQLMLKLVSFENLSQQGALIFLRSNKKLYFAGTQVDSQAGCSFLNHV